MSITACLLHNGHSVQLDVPVICSLVNGVSCTHWRRALCNMLCLLLSYSVHILLTYQKKKFKTCVCWWFGIILHRQEFWNNEDNILLWPCSPGKIFLIDSTYSSVHRKLSHCFPWIIIAHHVNLLLTANGTVFLFLHLLYTWAFSSVTFKNVQKLTAGKIAAWMDLLCRLCGVFWRGQSLHAPKHITGLCGCAYWYQISVMQLCTPKENGCSNQCLINIWRPVTKN